MAVDKKIPFRPIPLGAFLIKNSLKQQFNQPLDFFIQFIIWFLTGLVPFGALSILFIKFESIGGQWTYVHISFFYAIVSVSYNVARMFGRTLDNFHHYVKTGALDPLFVRPVPLYFQILTENVFIRRLAGIGQGVLILLFSTLQLQYRIPAPMSVFFVFSFFCLMSCTLLFLGLLNLYGATCLWTIERNAFTDLFVDTSSAMVFYPIDKYGWPIKFFFTFAIPFFTVLQKPFSLLFFQDFSLLEGLRVLLSSLLTTFLFYSLTYVAFSKSLNLYKSCGQNQ